MPKTSDFPKFRTYVKRGPGGQTWTSYAYDKRGTGWPDVPLGNDKEQALKLWHELREAALRGEKMPAPAKRKARVQRIDMAPTAKVAGKRRNFCHPAWAAAPDWAKPLYLLVEARSRRDGRATFLSPAEYLSIVERANGRCELSGIAFDTTRPAAGKRAPFAPSLDRIDCGHGYVAGNVRLTTTIMNCALGDFGEAAFAVAADGFLRLRAGAKLPHAGATLLERLPT